MMLPSEMPTKWMRLPSRSGFGSPSGKLQARQRARERDRVGDGLADVIARVERVADVEDLPAVVDLPVGREYARGADVVEIEVALVVAERAVRALIERARRVRDAVQRQIDGNDGEPRLRERIGHREHHGAIQRDAVLENHDGPARARLRVAAAGVRQRREQRNAPVRHARDRRRVLHVRRRERRARPRSS